MKKEEHQIQVGIVKYLRIKGFLVFACPNGGLRSVGTARTLKAEGVLAGVSDLVILLPAGQVVFVEVKTPKGTQADSQKDFQFQVKEMGYEYLIWRSVDDAVAWVAAHRRAA
ncbi:hypothetical protein FACS1894186_5720 [Alphaproteobacteria bacterium]|nr:hypothetical protein FACS1894186_5720 [Alphaproteobacteria bacterium]